MIIYRPHRGSFVAAMAEAVEFENTSEMLAYIVSSEMESSPFGVAPFAADDLVVTGEPISDPRNGWEDTLCVCTRRYYNNMYPVPQAIGFCATKYRK